jgi:hypothetical protein
MTPKFFSRQSDSFVLKLLILIVLLLIASTSMAYETEEAVTIAVKSASAKVGEKTAIEVKISPLKEFKISHAYRNRVFELSSFDDGVEFDQKVVTGSLKGDDLMFLISAVPKTAGTHAVNGIIRIGFHYGERVDFKSIPLITTVTGTE